MLCSKCGTSNSEGSAFCKECGTPIKAHQATHLTSANHHKNNTTQNTHAPIDFYPFFLRLYKIGRSLKRKKQTKIQKIIGAGIIVVTILGAGVLVNIVNQNNQHTAAVNGFNDLVSEINLLQTNISTKAENNKTLLYITKKTDLADPSLLDQSQREIDSAKKVTVDIPHIATDTTTIDQQIKGLTAKVSDLQKQSDALDSALAAIYASKQKLADQIAAAKEAKLTEAITPKDTHVITATDMNGNKETITIKIGKWIKGSETATLDKAWKIVGGTDSMPLTNSYSDPSNYVGGNGPFHPESAAYVFGTVTIQNSTPSFSAKNFDNGDSYVSLFPTYLSPSEKLEKKCPSCSVTNGQGLKTVGLGQGVVCRQYSSGASCDIGVLARADMKQNTWGPLPFIIGIDTVFSPNFPDGNLKLNDVHFILSCNYIDTTMTVDDLSFQIGKSW